MISVSRSEPRRDEIFRLSTPILIAILLRVALFIDERSTPLNEQLIVRLLRLLQASGLPLDPNICRWGPNAAVEAPHMSATGAAATASVVVGGNPAIAKASSPSRGCAWLMSAFEPRRLRASIEAFPIERELEPPPFCFEVGSRKSEKAAAVLSSTGADAGRSSRADFPVADTSDSHAPGASLTKNRSVHDKNSDGVDVGDHGKRNVCQGKRRQRSDSVDWRTEENDGDETDGSQNSGDSSTTSSRDNGSSSHREENEDADDVDDDSVSDEDGSNRGGGGDGERRTRQGYRLELPATPETNGAVGAVLANADQVYDPCFVLPLLEWGLRAGGLNVQAVSMQIRTLLCRRAFYLVLHLMFVSHLVQRSSLRSTDSVPHVFRRE